MKNITTVIKISDKGLKEIKLKMEHITSMSVAIEATDLVAIMVDYNDKMIRNGKIIDVKRRKLIR